MEKVAWMGVVSSNDPDVEDFRGFEVLAVTEEEATVAAEALFPNHFVADIYLVSES